MSILSVKDFKEIGYNTSGTRRKTNKNADVFLFEFGPAIKTDCFEFGVKIHETGTSFFRIGILSGADEKSKGKKVRFWSIDFDLRMNELDNLEDQSVMLYQRHYTSVYSEESGIHEDEKVLFEGVFEQAVIGHGEIYYLLINRKKKEIHIRRDKSGEESLLFGNVELPPSVHIFFSASSGADLEVVTYHEFFPFLIESEILKEKKERIQSVLNNKEVFNRFITIPKIPCCDDDDSTTTTTTTTKTRFSSTFSICDYLLLQTSKKKNDEEEEMDIEKRVSKIFSKLASLNFHVDHLLDEVLVFEILTRKINGGDHQHIIKSDVPCEAIPLYFHFFRELGLKNEMKYVLGEIDEIDDFAICFNLFFDSCQACENEEVKSWFKLLVVDEEEEEEEEDRVETTLIDEDSFDNSLSLQLFIRMISLKSQLEEDDDDEDDSKDDDDDEEEDDVLLWGKKLGKKRKKMCKKIMKYVKPVSDDVLNILNHSDFKTEKKKEEEESVIMRRLLESGDHYNCVLKAYKRDDEENNKNTNKQHPKPKPTVNFKVHREIIASKTYFFSAMLRFGGLETEELIKNGTIMVNSCSSEVLELLINYIYLGRFNKLSSSSSSTEEKEDVNLELLLQVMIHADMYNERELLVYCLEILFNSPQRNDLSDVILYDEKGVFSTLYGNENLRKYIIPIFQRMDRSTLGQDDPKEIIALMKKSVMRKEERQKEMKVIHKMEEMEKRLTEKIVSVRDDVKEMLKKDEEERNVLKDEMCLLREMIKKLLEK